MIQYAFFYMKIFGRQCKVKAKFVSNKTFISLYLKIYSIADASFLLSVFMEL